MDLMREGDLMAMRRERDLTWKELLLCLRKDMQNQRKSSMFKVAPKDIRCVEAEMQIMFRDGTLRIDLLSLLDEHRGPGDV